MARLLVRADRVLNGVDAARVWAVVGDLTRFHEWFPVHPVGSMTGEAPEVGNVVFVTLRARADEDHPVRLEVRGWEAGTRLVFDVGGLAGVEGAELEVRVRGEPPNDTAHVMLRFGGDASGIRGRIVEISARRRFRKALDRLGELRR